MGCAWSAGRWVCQRPIPEAKQSKEREREIQSKGAKKGEPVVTFPTGIRISKALVLLLHRPLGQTCVSMSIMLGALFYKEPQQWLLLRGEHTLNPTKTGGD